jgi:hypothetical protein
LLDELKKVEGTSHHEKSCSSKSVLKSFQKVVYKVPGFWKATALGMAVETDSESI